MKTIEPGSAHVRRKAVTRDAIVETAFVMTRDQPGAPFSHEAIAARTGIAARTIYRHFPARADLTRALWLRLRQESGIQWPDTEAGIAPAVQGLFDKFEAHSALARASITAAAATEYPVHGSAEGRAAFRHSLAGVLGRLPAKQGDQLVAACVAIYSAPFWQMLRDRGQLSAKASGKTAAWVLEAVIASARVRARGSRTVSHKGRKKHDDAASRTVSRPPGRHRPHSRAAQHRR